MELTAAIVAGTADLEGREKAVKVAEQRLSTQQTELRVLAERSADLTRREAEVAAGQARLESATAAVTRERQAIARQRQQLQV